VLAVLVERGGADAVQLAAREGRLQHVAGVDGASALPAPTMVCSSSMKMMVLPSSFASSFSTLFSPLLEFAAVLGAGEQRGHVEHQQPLALQAFRHFLVDDALRQALDDGGLADARLADQHRLFLVRRCRIWMQRRISSSRPITGSSLPARARSLRSR